MTTKLMVTMIPPEGLPKVWWQIDALFEKLDPVANGRIERVDVLQDLQSGKQQIWVSFDEAGIIHSFMTTMIVQRPTGRTLVMYACAGDRVEDWYGTMHEMLNRYAFDYGCVRMEWNGRPGWERFLKEFDYKKLFVTCERDVVIPEEYRQAAE